jgi:MFS family permease
MALVTCTSMLTMDLYLPAIPALQQGLDLTVEQGQATVAVFLAGLALSQLVWGAALHRFGPRRCVTAGIAGLLAATLGCALAVDSTTLLAMRFVQGVAAGAATVVAPSVIRATLPEKDGVRGIAAIGMVEAIVPAAGPVVGTALLAFTDWRGTFWAIAILTLLAMPFAVAASPPRLPGHTDALPMGYRFLLRDGRYVRLALCHALGFGALMTFVASAPQLIAQSYGRGPDAFAFTQFVGVGAFILVASRAGRISDRIGVPLAIQLGAWLHVVLCAVLLAGAAVGLPSFGWIVVFWVGFCGVLGMRGPAAFSEALAVPSPDGTRLGAPGPCSVGGRRRGYAGGRPVPGEWRSAGSRLGDGRAHAGQCGTGGPLSDAKSDHGLAALKSRSAGRSAAPMHRRPLGAMVAAGHSQAGPTAGFPSRSCANVSINHTGRCLPPTDDDTGPSTWAAC